MKCIFFIQFLLCVFYMIIINVEIISAYLTFYMVKKNLEL